MGAFYHLCEKFPDGGGRTLAIGQAYELVSDLLKESNPSPPMKPGALASSLCWGENPSNVDVEDCVIEWLRWSRYDVSVVSDYMDRPFPWEEPVLWSKLPGWRHDRIEPVPNDGYRWHNGEPSFKSAILIEAILLVAHQRRWELLKSVNPSPTWTKGGEDPDFLRKHSPIPEKR